MKCFILFTFFILCFGNIQAHPNSLSLASYDVDDSNHKTQLMDLDDDCQYPILEQLTVSDLYSLSRTNKYYERFAGKIVKRIFAKKILMLGYLLANGGDNDYTESEKYVILRHAEPAIKILKQFGRYIQTLMIHNVGREEEDELENHEAAKKVYKIIEEYCSETLTEFQYKNVKHNFFKYVTKPFNNVHSVILDGQIGSLGNDHLNFQQMFPAMRSLHVEFTWLKSTSTITLEYPQLEHLEWEIPVNDGYLKEPVIAEIVKKNPHIRSITLSNVNSDLLPIVSENLINLEQLTLFNFVEQDPNVQFHFERVKGFKIINGHSQSMPANITFDEHLEEFEVNADITDHKYIHFIENHHSLKKIHINGHISIFGPTGLFKEDIQRLALANLNVIEMSLAFGSNVKGENFIPLIQNSKQLNQLNLKMISSIKNKTEDIFAILHEEFAGDFILRVNDNDIILNRRKNYTIDTNN